MIDVSSTYTHKPQSRGKKGGQYTVRGVPKQLDFFVRTQARIKDRSLNQYLLDLIYFAAKQDAKDEIMNRDLDWFFDSWSNEEADAFDKKIANFEKLNAHDLP